MKIFSKVEKDKIILSVLKFKDISKNRNDISPENEFLQTSGRVLNKDFQVKLHKHNKLKRVTDITLDSFERKNFRKIL